MVSVRFYPYFFVLTGKSENRNDNCEQVDSEEVESKWLKGSSSV